MVLTYLAYCSALSLTAAQSGNWKEIPDGWNVFIQFKEVTMKQACRYQDLSRRFFSVKRMNFPAQGKWGDIARCSRAVRAGNTVYVSGTCAEGKTAREQMINIFKIITPALQEVGASLDDVVSTRLFASDVSNDWEGAFIFSSPSLLRSNYPHNSKN